ncbi:MAG TPA: PepSY-associated TM helix domain-containing protein, partial [Chitinophagaceae bacterium]|nr:PepSY-associated TM helix domain-containing protein [Chitinophagaceae bacterium]
RKNHDLHSALAFYSLVILLLMGLTGPFFSFTWYRSGLQKTLGTYKAPVPSVREKKSKGDTAAQQIPKRLTVAEYLGVANAQLEYEGDYTFSLPVNNANTVTIAKNRRGFFAPAAADRLTLDVATGEIKKKEIFRDKPFNERVGGSIKALHVGNVYGTFTKIIYFLACLIATSLPVTGTLIWWNKLKKNSKAI